MWNTFLRKARTLVWPPLFGWVRESAHTDALPGWLGWPTASKPHPLLPRDIKWMNRLGCEVVFPSSCSFSLLPPSLEKGARKSQPWCAQAWWRRIPTCAGAYLWFASSGRWPWSSFLGFSCASTRRLTWLIGRRKNSKGTSLILRMNSTSDTPVSIKMLGSDPALCLFWHTFWVVLSLQNSEWQKIISCRWNHSAAKISSSMS